MFKSSKVYILVSRNKVKAINLKTGEQVIRSADIPFSGERQVVSNFSHADKTIRAALKELSISRNFSRLKILIQQMEGTEGGLSDIEKRALRDLGEIAGASKVELVEHERELPLNEAFEWLK
jgi:hypothetical protein